MDWIKEKVRLADKDIYYDAIPVRPKHQEAMKEIERQEKENECKQSVYSRKIDERP